MKEALKLALEALQKTQSEGYNLPATAISEAITAIKAALAQPAQREPVAWSSYEYDGIHHKPVAWMDGDGNFSDNNDHKCFPIPLYTITHPPRPWVRLTDEDQFNLVHAMNKNDWHAIQMMDAIEAKLKEKNT